MDRLSCDREELARLCQRNGIRRLSLFGSYARGDARDDRDLELLVVEPEVNDAAAEMVRLSSPLGYALIPADVVVMSRSTFERQRAVPNTLGYRAAQEGGVHDLIRSHT